MTAAPVTVDTLDNLENLELVPALLSAADAHVTGRLSTALPDGDAALVFVSEGQVYGVVAHDGSATLGERLVASGVLSGADLETALEAQRTDMPGWRIGELLVHLGFVEPEQVQDCLHEQMREMLAWLLTQPLDRVAPAPGRAHALSVRRAGRGDRAARGARRHARPGGDDRREPRRRAGADHGQVGRHGGAAGPER